jgi:hypothetical protein
MRDLSFILSAESQHLLKLWAVCGTRALARIREDAKDAPLVMLAVLSALPLLCRKVQHIPFDLIFA